MLTLWPSPNKAYPYFRARRLSSARVLSVSRGGRRRRAVISFLTIIASIVPGFSAAVPPRVEPSSVVHEQSLLSRASAHVVEFSPVSASPLAIPRCASVRQPESLLTPDPLLPPEDDRVRVIVSFIIGSDGHVHSAFVTYSGGVEGDQVVLRAVRAWRYRPALCNGVPTDSEARVRFTAHD